MFSTGTFPMHLALFQPDIPANTGTMMRLCACLGLSLDIIEPCGFVFDDKKLKRAAMDYINHLSYTRHENWGQFVQKVPGRKLLLTTKAAMPYTAFTYQPDDILIVGQESAGVPEYVHNAVEARLLIPMQPPLRSLNVAISAAMVIGEALRQTGGI